jgi:hypothetical protein
MWAHNMIIWPDHSYSLHWSSELRLIHCKQTYVQNKIIVKHTGCSFAWTIWMVYHDVDFVSSGQSSASIRSNDTTFWLVLATMKLNFCGACSWFAHIAKCSVLCIGCSCSVIREGWNRYIKINCDAASISIFTCLQLCRKVCNEMANGLRLNLSVSIKLPSVEFWQRVRCEEYCKVPWSCFFVPLSTMFQWISLCHVKYHRRPLPHVTVCDQRRRTQWFLMTSQISG